ncbi:MAG: UDP-N-acetylglucosamine--N-acetylmuramyl-(pentapeptide) pyrophosphoryl-undecaprenol N-acetylglucosamine transferase [bacterium]|nr:UDP-N-acetylglucosamine--N-acetylmuramyl-(pentapeptide) pyrophosphoryl-undecaprenol N-acetylglucosamine transferase [bacterium]
MNNPSKIIIFTGGGTTGHVTKNLIVMSELKKKLSPIELHYLGSNNGKEKELVNRNLCRFHAISTGKFRRYFALESIPDFFRFLRGVWQSFWLLKKIRPNLVFSSGGYVALPVAIGAWMNRIPMITHETDSTPGLANRWIARLAEQVLLGFESARPYFKNNTIFVGNPISPGLFKGSKEKALHELGFSRQRKTLLVMGGSQGAKQINELVWELLPKLLEHWQVIHLTGKGKMNTSRNDSFYQAFEYITDDYTDFLTAADLVISRAGGNSLAELEALNKLAIIIPLRSAAGDHQMKNALEMKKKHPDWVVLKGPEVSSGEVWNAVNETAKQTRRMAVERPNHSSAEQIVHVLLQRLSEVVKHDDEVL